MSRALVSVILPAYNAERYLGQAIQSMLNQTLHDLELIVVDDASTDASLEVALSFDDPRMRVLSQAQNLGYPSAMNRGLRVAVGEFIARMDADDFSVPERLARQVGFLAEHGECAFVGTASFWLTPRGKMAFRHMSQTHGETGWVEETWERVFTGKRRFTDASVVAKREDVDRVGAYRTYQRTGQDVDLWLRLLESGKAWAATILQPLYGRRLHLDAITFSEGTIAKNKIPRMMANERQARGTDAVIRGEVPKPITDATVRAEARKWRTSALWNAALTCVSSGDRLSSLAFAHRAVLSGGLTDRSLRLLLQYLLCFGGLLPGRRGRLPAARSSRPPQGA